ncbi:hypothetical protein E8E13_007440 [Curvularia kusanoi]|uniref:C2H2-type domain-containing protein n=1 Tax=Curvularia kusanoi TaxID=90978 RepID=A0A9P4T9Q4_CURKU|nr:hypothetical protein E8E13_007440 [Curvularia kusanoi]
MLHLWIEGHGADSGKLDLLLLQSAEVRQATLEVLIPLCQILLIGLEKLVLSKTDDTAMKLHYSNTKGLISETKVSNADIFDGIGDESESEIEAGIENNLEDQSDGDTEEKGNSARTKAETQPTPVEETAITRRVKTYTYCLVALGRALDCPAPDSRDPDPVASCPEKQREALASSDAEDSDLVNDLEDHSVSASFRKRRGHNNSSALRGKSKSRHDSAVASARTSTKTSGRRRQHDHERILEGRTEKTIGRHGFPCPLAAYNCGSNFASKNEWKRHVSTQHIKLGFWRCDLCPPTTDPNEPSVLYYNDFNRKDLFTQHLRRMHAAHGTGARHLKEFPVNDDNMSEHQARCFQHIRKAPQQSICPMEGCDCTFEGPRSWEERMDHVGRHLEKSPNKETQDVSQWSTDTALEAYLLEEGIIVREKDNWKIGDGEPLRNKPTIEIGDGKSPGAEGTTNIDNERPEPPKENANH